MTTQFCNNLGCNNPATGVVAISVQSYGDVLYRLCDPCTSAFAGGIQHGIFRTVSHFASPCTHVMGVPGKEEGVVLPSPELFFEAEEVVQKVREATRKFFADRRQE